MYIETIPVVEGTTVVNKQILYSETLLEPKENNNRNEICCIDNISKYSLETCIIKILESNKEVIFNTIQYSKKENKLYFYTNKKISTVIWQKRQKTQTITIDSERKVLEEVKRLLEAEEPQDSDCISLYTLEQILRNYYLEQKNVIEKYEHQVKNILGDYYAYFSRLSYNQVNVRVNSEYLGPITYEFLKSNNGFRIKDKQFYAGRAEEKMNKIEKIIPNLLEELDKFDNYTPLMDTIQPLNSNFLIQYAATSIKVYAKYLLFSVKDDFNLDKMYCESYRKNLVEVITGYETEILKNIYIRIDDCPEWCQDTLYQIRQKQLKKNKSLLSKAKQFIKEKKRK